MTGTANHMEKPFHGPLFVVGLPRSGTKLLRGLLNEHPFISLTTAETEFFPYWAEHWPSFGDLSDFERFTDFYNEMMRLPYFYYQDLENNIVDLRAWYEQCSDFSAADVFENLIRLDVDAPREGCIIWGDKSPAYVDHLPLLDHYFPQARFIHIIRDVRDYCLSIHKAWGKNMVRAAQRWVDSITKARADGSKLTGRYHEITYENLLEDPREQLEAICAFLGVDFDERMLTLSKAPENLGDAVNQTVIVRSNKAKYFEKLNPNTLKKIEAIAVSTLDSLGYTVHNSVRPRRIPAVYMLSYKLLDGINLFKANVKRRGIKDSVKLIKGFTKIKSAPKNSPPE